MPQVQPTQTHHPVMHYLASLRVYLKSAIFLFDHSENSQPIKREAQNVSFDWLTNLLSQKLQWEEEERGDVKQHWDSFWYLKPQIYLLMDINTLDKTQEKCKMWDL